MPSSFPWWVGTHGRASCDCFQSRRKRVIVTVRRATTNPQMRTLDGRGTVLLPVGDFSFRGSNRFWRSAFHSGKQLLRIDESSRANGGSKYSNTSNSPLATPPGRCAAPKFGPATCAGPQPIRAKPRRRLALPNLAVRGFDHPGELLQRVDDLVKEIACAGVDGVVHITRPPIS